MKDHLLTVFGRANLQSVLRKFTHNQHLIDEISQDVYLTVLERCKNQPQPPNVTCLRIAAVNKWKDELRHRYRHRRLLNFLEYEFDEADRTAGNSPLLEAMEEKLSQLPPQYKQVLALKLNGFDLTNTAKVMRIGPDQARQLRTCALRRLRQQFSRDSN